MSILLTSQQPWKHLFSQSNTQQLWFVWENVEDRCLSKKGKQSRGLPRKNCVNSEPGGGLLVVV